MNVVLLVNKLDWNGVTLRAKPTLKILRFLGIDNINARRVRSFPKVTMGFCRSTGCKDTSCQSWRSEKNPATRPDANQTQAARVRVLDDQIIFKVWLATTLQTFNLQRLTVPFLKDLNLIYWLSLFEETRGILKIGFALSKWPHFNSAYVLKARLSIRNRD